MKSSKDQSAAGTRCLKQRRVKRRRMIKSRFTQSLEWLKNNDPDYPASYVEYAHLRSRDRSPAMSSGIAYGDPFGFFMNIGIIGSEYVENGNNVVCLRHFRRNTVDADVAPVTKLG